MTAVLSQRRLNRATLARQYLLHRAPASVIDAVEHLAGMQSQAPLAPYLGLWSRLQDFSLDELSALTEQRQVVRLHLMRNTVHLVSARDCLDWRALFCPLHAAEFTAHFGRGTGGVDRGMVLEHAKRLLAEQPRTRAELGRLLGQRWPAADPAALAYAATHHIALCQVPPRGIWGTNGPAAWVTVETWLGKPLRSVPVDVLVLRYLGGFGPATVADIQTWSGLTRLREVAERLPLRTFRPAVVDAPVMGSVASAAAGTLTVLAGGDVSRVEGVLTTFGTVVACGELGAGAARKILLINAVIGGIALASDLVALADQLGVPDALSILADGPLSQTVARARATSADFPIRLAVKDVGLALDHAQLPVLAAIRERLLSAADKEADLRKVIG